MFTADSWHFASGEEGGVIPGEVSVTGMSQMADLCCVEHGQFLEFH